VTIERHEAEYALAEGVGNAVDIFDFKVGKGEGFTDGCEVTLACGQESGNVGWTYVSATASPEA